MARTRTAKKRILIEYKAESRNTVHMKLAAWPSESLLRKILDLESVDFPVPPKFKADVTFRVT